MTLTARVRTRLLGAVLAVSAAALLSGCNPGDGTLGARAYRPIPPETLALMQEKGTTKNAPMLIRAYKKEAEFEVWKQKADGRYEKLKTFPMCRWSGQLGPKVREGDRQVPEGFYKITPGQMNPNSNYYLSFNVGYPNAYDRAYGHTGGSIMVHGACSSAGCFSMTDDQIGEIYALAREAFAGGQREIQMQSLPFRMTAENLAKHRADPNIAFWKELKTGSDHFEVTKQEPQVAVCNRHYVYDAKPDAGARLDALSVCPPLHEDPTLRSEVAAKQSRDDVAVAELVAKGVKAVRVVYADGGQHPDFASRSGDVSRPDALAQGVTEIALDDGPKGKPALVQMAAAKAEAVRRAAEPASTLVAANVVAAQPPIGQATAVPATFAAAPSVYATDEQADAAPAQPFYKKWLGGSDAAVAKSPALAVVEMADPVPADVPLPPRRDPGVSLHAAGKPAVSKLPTAITGALPAMPAGLRAYSEIAD